MPSNRTSLGFTFVEVIVVGVIVAILAAVCIPLYSGYVKNQKLAVVKGLAESGAVSANVFWRRQATTPDSADLKLFLPNPEEYNVRIAHDSVLVSTGAGADKVEAGAKFR